MSGTYNFMNILGWPSRTIILPVMYGCETWSLTLREVRRLRVLENRGLRKVFGSKRDEVTGEWRKLKGGSNMTGTDLCVNKPHCAAAVRP
jgi:hypothetical protein